MIALVGLSIGLAAAGAWLSVELDVVRTGEVSPDTIVVIAGESYTRADLERVLGRSARFDSTAVAESALRHFVDEVVVARARGLEPGAEEPSTQRRAWLEDYAARRGLHRAVTDSRIEAYYEAHRDDYVRPLQVRLTVMALPGDLEPSQVQSLYLQAQAGRSPRSLVGYLRAFDRHFRGRDLGLVDCDGGGRDALPEAVLQSACGAQPGEILSPIAVEGGWYLVRNTGRRTGRNVSLAAARPGIRRLLEDQEERALRDRVIADLRERAAVWISDRAVPALVEPARPAVAPAWPPAPAESAPPKVPGGVS